MYEDICVPLGCHNPFHDHHDESRLSKLVDTTDPAFHSIAEVLADMASARVEFTPEIIDAAVKAGRARHARETTIPTLPHQPGPEAVAGSVVYYIRRGNLIKIGTTTNLRRRMAALMPDEILAVEPGDWVLEQQRHRQFGDQRISRQGEYFFPGPALRRHVAEVRATHGAPPADLPRLAAASRDWAQPLAETRRTV
ncbi:GIY-YIG nuclease family protein [Streptomyces virginiae]|uniref:GIY-YIG nuclease family protein n=1 Tax=Streptomyces virginiae TaxID=1961 RepID=UPI00368A53DB